MSVTFAPRGTHLGERLVAGRVEERDPAFRAVLRSGLSGLVTLCVTDQRDDLRDAADFALGDVRPADLVEQRRLAVVDVAHDRNDRRAAGGASRGRLDPRDRLEVLAEQFFRRSSASSQPVRCSSSIAMRGREVDLDRGVDRDRARLVSFFSRRINSPAFMPIGFGEAPHRDRQGDVDLPSFLTSIFSSAGFAAKLHDGRHASRTVLQSSRRHRCR